MGVHARERAKERIAELAGRGLDLPTFWRARDAWGMLGLYREQDITRLVLRGDSTAQAAESLFISPQTVQQHLKSVFEKTGVPSRRDLVGKVFSPITSPACATTNGA